MCYMQLNLGAYTQAQQFAFITQDGHENGLGVFTFRDGATYDGFWKAGVKHGIGVYRPASLTASAAAPAAAADRPAGMNRLSSSGGGSVQLSNGVVAGDSPASDTDAEVRGRHCYRPQYDASNKLQLCSACCASHVVEQMLLSSPYCMQCAPTVRLNCTCANQFRYLPYFVQLYFKQCFVHLHETCWDQASLSQQ